MELPKRKLNRLKNYNYSSCGSYFITLCTLNRNCCLGSVSAAENKNSKIVLSDYGKSADKYIEYINGYANVSVDNYVIMPNHIHLIITLVGDDAPGVPKDDAPGVPKDDAPGVPKGDAPGVPKDSKRQNEIIPKIVSAFKRFVNKETGHDIWQRSYHDRVIRNEKEYEKIYYYINHNPETWADDIFNDNIIR